MDCDPSTLVRAARCLSCVPREMQVPVRLSLLCQWVNGGATPVVPVPVNTAVPVITGTVQDTFVLSGSNGTWTNVPTAYTYQWYANGVAIGGATANTFLLTSAQVGKTITFTVTASNAGGAGAPATSAATAAVLAVALFYVTTTAPGQILTIAELTVTSAMTVDWGDTQTNSYTGAGARTHTYAAAGTYTIKLLSPLLVTVLNLSDNKITLNSADIAPILNVLDFRASGLKAGTFDSVDVSAWRPAIFQLFSMPAGYAGTFNSADVSAWRPTYFYLYSMPAGYAGTFNSADVSAWRPTTFYLYSMPAGYAGTFNSVDVSAWRAAQFSLYSMPAGYAGTFNSTDVSAWRPIIFQLFSMPTATFTIIISAGGFSGWVSTTTVNMSANSLAQASVDQILADFYTAFATRTATGGTITLNGTGNAAPSGIFQAMCPPTSGKETAYELLNDSCAINPTKKWSTVTTN